MMVLLLPDLQKIMGRHGQVTGFAVMVDHPDDKAEVQRICGAIEALGPKTIEAKNAVDSVKGTTEIRFIRAMSWLTSAIAIIIGVVGMLNTMIMSVAERTREIGILRAIGWKKVAHRADDPGRVGPAESLRRRARRVRGNRRDEPAWAGIPPSPA